MISRRSPVDIQIRWSSNTHVYLFIYLHPPMGLTGLECSVRAKVSWPSALPLGISRGPVPSVIHFDPLETTVFCSYASLWAFGKGKSRQRIVLFWGYCTGHPYIKTNKVYRMWMIDWGQDWGCGTHSAAECTRLPCIMAAIVLYDKTDIAHITVALHARCNVLREERPLHVASCMPLANERSESSTTLFTNMH